tara:strand:- start:816 stop:1184 length:369 start_codon:yes stop_codon:yes gene_type:complete
MSENNKAKEILERIANAVETLSPDSDILAYPDEALPRGTLVRSNRLDSLGVITDAFYGELDKNNKKIIIYTVLLFPKKDAISQKTEDKYYLSNEYEYEITAYLMMNPINLNKFKQILGGSLF